MLNYRIPAYHISKANETFQQQQQQQRQQQQQQQLLQLNMMFVLNAHPPPDLNADQRRNECCDEARYSGTKPTHVPSWSTTCRKRVWPMPT
jgi:hypothetical protein